MMYVPGCVIFASSAARNSVFCAGSTPYTTGPCTSPNHRLMPRPFSFATFTNRSRISGVVTAADMW